MTTNNTIRLVGDYRREEAVPAAAFYPGHLVEWTSAGKVQKHATEGGYAERMVAVADVLQGKEITDAYGTSDIASVDLPVPGAVYRIFVKAGQDIAIADKLISAGDGTLIENGQESSGVTVKQIIAVAMEDCDLTASGAVDTLCKVRIL